MFGWWEAVLDGTYTQLQGWAIRASSVWVVGSGAGWYTYTATRLGNKG